MVVQIFGSTDRVAGPAAADDLRDRLIRAFPSRTLWVVPKEEQVPFLEQSGFPANQQLSISDEAALAKILRADEYLRGHVVRDGAAFKVTAWIVLTRDPALTQPLPIVSGPRADRAGADLVDLVKEARKQLVNEKRCIELARGEKLDEAVKAADAAILEYPNATLVRYCKLNVLYRRKAPNAQIIAMADEILAIDPNAKAALQVAADIHKQEGNVKKSNELLVRLLALEPTNAMLATQVVDALAASRDFAVAKQIVTKAVVDNPGDVALVSLQFRILAAAGDYKPAIRTGEEMVQMDTSLADASFFMRLAALYATDSQPQKSAEAYARATRKFPNNADLWQFYAQSLKNAGQVQQSIAAAKRALEVNPKIPNGWTQIAVAYNELGFPDSALVALREARTAGDDINTVGGFALNMGNRLFQLANRDSTKKVDSFKAPLPYLHFADSTVSDATIRTNAKFLVGVSSFYIAQLTAADLATSRSCDLAKAAQAASVDAQIYTAAGGRAFPDNAAAVMNALNTLAPYVEAQIRALCR